MTSNLHLLESLSYNAWPAFQTIIYDGWILRTAAGYTKRANSINPLYPSTLPVAQKIAYCEEYYQSQQLPVVFKLTPKMTPPDLEELLESRNYIIKDKTSVQIVELSKINHVDQKIPSYTAPKTQNGISINIQSTLTPIWFTSFTEFNGISHNNQESLDHILTSILPDHWFFYLNDRDTDQVIACGLGVAQNGYFGLFDIIVKPSLRHQKIGTHLISAMLQFAKNQHFHTAYLQVMYSNPAALHLYQKFGFTELYTYWYRILQ